MSDFNLDRRRLVAAAAIVAATAAGSAHAQAQTQTPSHAGPPPFAPTAMPLPFDPKAITGLSEKLLISHHDNNYVGAVKRLSAISAQFNGLDPSTAPGFVINGLKREELIAWNSMVLHLSLIHI